jgi:predicted PurR-regulated permease PerM
VGRPTAEAALELRQGFERQLSVIVAGALPFLHTAAGAIFGAVLAAIAGLYLAIDPETYVQGFARLVPPAGRPRFIRALYAVGADLRHWLLGTAINMLLIGIMTTVGLLLLGIPAAFALGMIALFLEFIPIYGPWLSAIPAVLVALLSSPADAFWVAVLYLCVQEVEAHLMSPLVMKGAVRIPPLLTLLIGAFMAVLFGFLGLVLAVPLLATTMVLLKRLYIEPLEERAAAGEEIPPPPEPHPDAA